MFEAFRGGDDRLSLLQTSLNPQGNPCHSLSWANGQATSLPVCFLTAFKMLQGVAAVSDSFAVRGDCFAERSNVTSVREASWPR